MQSHPHLELLPHTSRGSAVLELSLLGLWLLLPPSVCNYPLATKTGTRLSYSRSCILVYQDHQKTSQWPIDFCMSPKGAAQQVPLSRLIGWSNTAYHFHSLDPSWDQIHHPPHSQARYSPTAPLSQSPTTPALISVSSDLHQFRFWLNLPFRLSLRKLFKVALSMLFGKVTITPAFRSWIPIPPINVTELF